MERQRILIVEDDVALAEALDDQLRHAYGTRVVHRGRDALLAAAREVFDLVVLDLNLPDIDGIEIAERLQASEAPILMLTARADVRSRVIGLYAGASDYLPKPFDMSELLARVHAQLRHRDRHEVRRWGPIELDEAERRCTVAGEPLLLRALEFQLLALLMANQGRVYSKATLEERLYTGEGPASNAVEVLVSRLRSRLAEAGVDDVVDTVRGLGYVIREQRT
jgi:two-component system, OmpR family, response regulator QseB